MTARLLTALFAAEALLGAAIGVVALDMRAHYRVEDLGGVNVWGYRGPVMNRKQPNEIRIAMAGGDLAFGWGVAAAETMPHFLRGRVMLELDRGQSNIKATAVTIAARGLARRDYAAWIERYAALEPDIVCLLPDDDRHPLADGRFLPDRGSRLFESLGYSPILPLVLQEKGARSGSGTILLAGRVLERVDPHRSVEPLPPPATPDALVSAAAAALRVARIGVVFIVPPGVTPPSGPAMADPRLRVVDLRAAAIMNDPALRLDGFALSVAGHSRAADAVAPAVFELIRASGRVRS